MNRLPTVPLALLATLVSGANLLTVPGAHADSQAVEVADLPPPEALPTEAFLTGALTQAQSTMDGLEVSLERDGEHLVALIRNTSDFPKHFEHMANVSVTSGSMASRMGPMTFNLAEVPVVAEVAPGTTHRHRFEDVKLDAPQPEQEQNIARMLDGFSTLTVAFEDGAALSMAGSAQLEGAQQSFGSLPVINVEQSARVQTRRRR
ncbi:MAG: hypothetical protein EP330_29175 [Deltaproteobacteria bacterium]|nr:MAG: hypothetical protein EP330_29175 [Deltaproteobacteria bacterium]